MLLILLSTWSTLRVILILLLIYMVLRMIMNSRRAPSDRPPGGHWSNDPQRPKGDVRIERPNGRGQGSVEDADYEEIK
jgi:hypothetical protein